jgi:Uma2 family endonuclease
MNMIPPDLLVEDPPLERGFEWVEGQAVEKPMGAKASVVGARLIARLEAHVEAHGLGFVFNSEGAYQVTTKPQKKIRKPDASFVAKGRFANDVVPDGNITIAPDLAVEVVSPNDLAMDLEQRITDMLEFGAKLIWIVYPNTRSVLVQRADGSAARLTEDKDLSGEAIIPGFSCRIATLFTGI